MKTRNKVLSTMMAVALLAAVSCKKENSIDVDQTTTGETANTSMQAIVVAASSGGDSIYIINTCNSGQTRDSIAFGSLPASITTYLTTNYAGYTEQKAFSVNDTTDTLSGYVVVIQLNGKPVGLKFDASGTFVRVLEQREGRDFRGHGYHAGGRFEDRDGRGRDTIALTSLPAGVTSYFNGIYPADTLVRAIKGRDSSIVVLSLNNGVFATVFDASGTFVSRVSLPAKHGKANNIDVAALPAVSQAYLTTTYPNYVFKYAFKVVANNAVQGYVVFIDANGTKYAVQFDASGTFVKAVTVR
jgi:hypothetical protein